MASRCSGMTMLMRQTRLGILGLSFLGILAALVLVMYFTCRIYAPLNSLFASMSKIASGELEYPVYVPKKGLIRETALCLQSLTEQLKKQILSLRDGAHEREAILNAVWGYDEGETRTVDNHVSRLRKLGIDYIETVFGVGYKFVYRE